MKPANWIAVPVFTLLAFSPAFAGQTQATPPKDKNVVEKSKDAVVKGAKATAEATKDGISKTGEVMTDAWINSRVAGRFVDEPLLKDSNINVDVSKHVVTLKGTVMSRAGRSRAMTVAAKTEGVHHVVNQLTIGPKKS
ncbi:MAG: BON domain-containing protein [Vicinamibacterales bacterium]